MENYIIQGSKPLYGEVAISGDKNAVLPILAACLLCKETCVIHNVPFLKDVFVMTEVLEELGAQLKWEGHTLVINCANVIPKPVKWEISQKMRASNLVLGPLLGRFGEGEVAYPGGCSIGARPMDLHLTALRQFGCKIVETAHGVAANAKRLHGAVCRLAFPSVGATENALMAAVLATGETCIQNGAQEPEIIDLVQFLSAMGAKIQRKADGTFLVAGVSVLHGGHCSTAFVLYSGCNFFPSHDGKTKTPGTPLWNHVSP